MARHAADPDPAYSRGQMAARIAVRDASTPEALALVRRHAHSALEMAEQGLADAQGRYDHAQGYLDHLTDLKENTA